VKEIYSPLLTISIIMALDIENEKRSNLNHEKRSNLNRICMEVPDEANQESK